MRQSGEVSWMRVLKAMAVAGLLCICLTASARESQTEQAVTVRSLTINAPGVAADESQRIAQKFQGGNYSPEELSERVRQALRDEGYFEAKCELDGVKDSEDGKTADIKMRVNAGAQYRLAGIRFTNASLFPADQLRALFDIKDGALMNATGIGRGLDRMRTLYAENGYPDFGAIPEPQIDESRHTVALTITVDQGKQFYFGRVLAEGAEPKAGAAQSLKDAWASVHEKPYSPKLLNDWLTAHAPYWPAPEQPIDHVKLMENPETQRVDVVVEFP
jgi:outer membrane translocation and assembly module TamA